MLGLVQYARLKREIEELKERIVEHGPSRTSGTVFSQAVALREPQGSPAHEARFRILNCLPDTSPLGRLLIAGLGEHEQPEEQKSETYSA